jgi:hypothetical protein
MFAATAALAAACHSSLVAMYGGPFDAGDDAEDFCGPSDPNCAPLYGGGPIPDAGDASSEAEAGDARADAPQDVKEAGTDGD